MDAVELQVAQLAQQMADVQQRRKVERLATLGCPETLTSVPCH